MNLFRRLTLSTTRKSGWKVAIIFGFSALLVLGLLLARANTASAASSPSGATITSDKQDYQPGTTVTLTGVGWAANEAVHIHVADSDGTTWSFDSNPDPVADTSGAFTYQFPLPSSVIAFYTATATGATSGTATTAFTDSNCPSLSGKVASNLVSASSTTSGNTLTYTFSSVSQTQTATGVPGLIDYCVYPSGSTPLLPDSHTVQATGADNAAWVYDTGTGNFSFHRPDGGGDADNISLDGKTVTMGTATWSGNVPTSQTILLHINDATECNNLYGGNPGTCFVLPGTPQTTASDLTVTKTATPSFDRKFTWGITKSVVAPTKQTISDGGTATFNYTVEVTHDGGTDTGWQVTGTITVTNPNTQDFAGVNVTDAVDDGGTCNVTGGSNVTVPASGHVDLAYTCDYTTAPSPSNGTNKATAAWDKATYNTPDGTASGTATFDFSTATPTVTDGSVTVTDTLKGSLGTVTYNDPSPKDITYTLGLKGVGGTCTDYPNTASFKTDTSGTTGSASQTVTVCAAVDLQVAKDATPSFTRTYNWKIAKSVDKTLLDAGGTATYTVTVTEMGFTDSGWKVSGTITVTNPNDFESITLTDVKDAVDNGGSCTVSGTLPATIAASSNVTLSYSCTYSSAPTSSSGSNTATASWDQNAAFTPDGSAQGTKTFAFTTPTTTVNKTITVTDTIGGSLGTATATDDPTAFTVKIFSYTHTFTPPASGCQTVNNTATITETGQTASASVKNCNTGALTMGFWQNKNGQGIISAANQTNLGNWLRAYHPFSDAPSSNLAAYVSGIIKVATCSGPATSPCNAMLRAQMLATALDVYFSDPVLGGNKINAPLPIGGVNIDLIHICQMIDGSGGTATCSGTYEDASSAFGGSPKTVQDMLNYQNTSDPAADAGKVWYGNVKASQVLAKDAFDAINNQVASSP